MTQSEQVNHTFFKLRRLYWIALSAIALTIILSQVFVQSHLRRQVGDAEEINVAGRQRMLSQKLTKELLQYSSTDDQSGLATEIRATLSLWETAHTELSERYRHGRGQSSELTRLFEEIESVHQAMRSSALAILDGEEYEVHMADLLEHEPRFLAKMDEIVNVMDRNASQKVADLSDIERILLFIALGTLILELFFLFRPAAKAIQRTMDSLSESRDELQHTLTDLSAVSREKEQAYIELQSLQQAIDHAVLYATIRSDRSVVHASSQLRGLMSHSRWASGAKIEELCAAQPMQQEQLRAIVQAGRQQVYREEWQVYDRDDDIRWYDVIVVPVRQAKAPHDQMVIFNDVTANRQIQREIDQMKEEQFAKDLIAQKNKSFQVVEAQEEERKRIAKDIHDGIGQTLTALKFNLQSINMADPAKAQPKIDKLGTIVTQLIKEVRMATFNLTPPELTDYGLNTALEKMADYLSRVTNVDIRYTHSSTDAARFDPVVENNIYRVTQEAVNNAIKYAQTPVIDVVYTLSDEMLSVTVRDEGVGFDPSEVQVDSEQGTGMGLSYMRERIEFLRGRLFIQAKPGAGTRITINIPEERLYS